MVKSLIIAKMHESQLQHLTGCRYAVIVHLARVFKAAMSGKGRPHQHGLLVTVVLSLMKLRLNVSVITL